MGNIQEISLDNVDSERIESILNRIIENTLSPYIVQIKKTGLKKQIALRVPGLDIDKKLISMAKKHLAPVREIELGKGIGRASLCYRNGKIIIKPSGTFALFINEITITDAQIIAAFDNVLDQIQKKYIDDLSFIKITVNEIIQNLSETGLYKPSTSEEKTLYDLILLILLSYDFKREESLPDWIKIALDNLEKEEIINSLLITIRDHVSMIATVISENLYIDLKRAIDSRILRVTLSKKTNKGQISGFLKLIGVDIKSKVEEFAKEYMSQSFVQGVGEIIVNIASSILYDIQDDESGISSDIDKRMVPFDITVTFGKNPKTQRAFRWYTSRHVEKSFIYISKSKDFSEFIELKAEYESVLNPKTVYDLGPLSKYAVVKVSKFSCVVCDLDYDTKYYYKVGDISTGNISNVMSFKTGKSSNSFTFISLADSQGMVKSNYDLFNNTFKAAIKNFPEAEFIAHLGDFVDDGNNEDYWEWLLENEVWQKNVVVPVAGNHEARVNHVVYESGAENSIISHFNVQGYPKQDTSTGIYYSFEYGNATFIVFNTNDLDKDKKIDIKQYKWALRVANNAKTKWKIVLIHKSPYSNGPHHDDDDIKAMTEQIINFCREAKIDLVIAGHDHVFVRTPVLVNGEKSRYNDKIIKRNGIKYETAINPLGTLFVVPGTSGAKNYSQDISAIIPSDVMEQPNCPVYSAITVEDDMLYFLSYKYNDVKGSSSLLDSYALEKTNIDYINVKSAKNKEKIKIKNAYKKIRNSSQVIVRNRSEFIQALNDESIGTIITEGNDIKIETIFGRKRNQVITRDICIRGSSCIYNVTFKVKKGATLIFKDLVTIDNTRTQGSLFPASNCVELYDDSVLVMDDYSSLRTEYGMGIKGFCVFMYGKQAKAYFNSESEQWGAKGSVYAVQKDSKIVINSGKFNNKRNRYSIKTCGEVIINGGKIKNLQAMHSSRVYLNNGVIGFNDNQNSKIFLTIYNKAYFSGGQIKEKNGPSINLADKNARLYIRPLHEGAVNICGMKPYLSKIKTDNFENVVSVPNADIGESDFQEYDKMFISGEKIYEFDELVELNSKELNTDLKENYIKASLPKGDLYVWARKLYVSDNKNVDHFKCSSGAKAFIYSDLRHITNYPVEKIYIEKVDTLKFSEEDENKYQLNYISYPEKALNDKVYWSVDDTEIAEIDNSGLLTIKGPGKFRVNAVLMSNSNVFCRREINVIR